jgi:hypothetical protein
MPVKSWSSAVVSRGARSLFSDFKIELRPILKILLATSLSRATDRDRNNAAPIRKGSRSVGRRYWDTFSETDESPG